MHEKKIQHHEVFSSLSKELQNILHFLVRHGVPATAATFARPMEERARELAKILIVLVGNADVCAPYMSEEELMRCPREKAASYRQFMSAIYEMAVMFDVMFAISLEGGGKSSPDVPGELNGELCWSEFVRLAKGHRAFHEKYAIAKARCEFGRGRAFCIQCGYKLQMPNQNCPECGRESP